MSHQKNSSVSSILSCRSSEYSCWLEAPYDTNQLIADANKIIQTHEKKLRNGHEQYKLDKLLYGMLSEAPKESGKRYVAIVIHIAHTKGEDAILEAAIAWLDTLFIPMLARPNHIRTEPTSVQTPTLHQTLQVIVPAVRTSSFKNNVAHREEQRCAITKFLDYGYVTSTYRGQDRPEVPLIPVQAAHIIPFSLNNFVPNTAEEDIAAWTWDLFQAWTGVKATSLAGANINSPANGIFMNAGDHTGFGRFEFYFDKEAFPESPNKYKLRMVRPGLFLANMKTTEDIEFRCDNPNIPPPNKDYMEIQASFAKVLNAIGAVL